MIKIKLFEHKTTEGLEQAVNRWITGLRCCDNIIDIQYRQSGVHNDRYSVCVTYREIHKKED